jgi:hypothetical protein
MKLLSTVLVLCACANELSAGPIADSKDALQINILAGHDVVVPADSKRGSDIRIRVTDRNNRPVEGAVVSAILPASGAGGHFRDRTTISTQETDSDGEARFTGIRLRNVLGEFSTTLKARRGENFGSTQVLQRVSSSAPAPERFFSRKRVVMMSVAGAGVAAAVVAATYGGTSATTAPSLTVTPGSPVTSAPR